MSDGLAPTPRGTMAADISNGLVRLHKRYYGKGPTKAKTYLVDDSVFCVLKEGFTTVEKTLIEDGQPDAVRNIRRSFQAAMREQFRSVVEGATGRGVIAYMSQVHTDPDVSLEVFLLEPDGAVLGEHEADIASGEVHEEDAPLT
jgi:uncharacterized protein YbcI